MRKALLIILLHMGTIPAQDVADPVTILLAKNRDILAARKSHEAALENVKVFGVLPDPMVESSLFLKPLETRNGPMEGQVMVGQRFPLWGKLKRERKVAQLKAEMAYLTLEQKKIGTVFQMRKGWENYVRLKNSLDILERFRHELDAFRSVSLTQYSTGTGVTQHPILKLQIEISLVESQINSLQGDLESVVNNLQSLFDGSFSPDLFAESRSALIPPNPTEFWMNMAKGTNPSYLKAQRELKVAHLQHELAVRKNYPDLVTGVTYTAVGPTDLAGAVSSGADALGLKAGLNLPIWIGRNRARIESSRLGIKSREELVKAVWNQIEDDIRSTEADLSEIEKTFLVYQGKLVQESEQLLSSAFSAYETGKVSFLDLLDSERMVVKVRLDFERIDAERRIASARMLKAVGLIGPEEE
ncbi:MAG: TolC family protein [Fidelibacterota bacterium]